MLHSHSNYKGHYIDLITQELVYEKPYNLVIIEKNKFD